MCTRQRLLHMEFPLLNPSSRSIYGIKMFKVLYSSKLKHLLILFGETHSKQGSGCDKDVIYIVDYVKQLIELHPNRFFDFCLEASAIEFADVKYQAHKSNSPSIRDFRDVFQPCLSVINKCPYDNVRLSYVDPRINKSLQVRLLNLNIALLFEFAATYRKTGSALFYKKLNDSKSTLNSVDTQDKVNKLFFDTKFICREIDQISDKFHKMKDKLKVIYKNLSEQISLSFVRQVRFILAELDRIVNSGLDPNFVLDIKAVNKFHSDLNLTMADILMKYHDLYSLSRIFHQFKNGLSTSQNVIFFGGRLHTKFIFDTVINTYDDYQILYDISNDINCIPEPVDLEKFLI